LYKKDPSRFYLNKEAIENRQRGNTDGSLYLTLAVLVGLLVKKLFRIDELIIPLQRVKDDGET
jgi:hypothetical protein